MTPGLLLLMLGSGLAFATTIYGPRALRAPMGLFNGMYILTTAIGATIFTFPIAREFWELRFPAIDEDWLPTGGSFGYWFLVWGPMLITNFSAVIFYPLMRPAAIQFARLVNRHVDILPTACAGLSLSAYCLVNLAFRGYLSVNVFSAKSIGMYRENILLRVEMFNTLGTLHFACIYMGIPAIAMVALYNFSRRRNLAWLILFVVLSAILVFMYATTLTKSNILIYGLEVTIGAGVLGLIRLRGGVLAAILGILTLSVLMSLLSGTGSLDIAIAGLNIIFREASGVPFYLGIFPDQIPFTGIDLGLRQFGIGPEVTANLTVANFMSPESTWVQGAAAIAAHISSYAQGGFSWSFVTMVVIGAWIAFSGQLHKITHGAVVFSAFIGSLTTCYYLTQADFVGAFTVAYGYKWWIASLFFLIGIQTLMQRAIEPSTGAPLSVQRGAL